MNEQPEALGYANNLESRGYKAEAAELRRLHAEVERLRANQQPPVVELEPLCDYVIQELADDGVFRANVFEIVRRIEEEHGIFKLR